MPSPNDKGYLLILLCYDTSSEIEGGMLTRTKRTGGAARLWYGVASYDRAACSRAVGDVAGGAGGEDAGMRDYL